MNTRSPFLLLLIYVGFTFLLTSCGDDGEDEAEVLCVTDLTGSPTFSSTVAYTNDTISISGFVACENDDITVEINGTEVNTFNEEETSVQIRIPSLDTESLEIQVRVNTVAFGDAREFDLFPGGGIWNEVASFPGGGRSQLASFSGSGVGYIAGGNEFRGISAIPKEVFFNELYQYQAASNTWTLLSSNDLVLDAFNGAVWNNQIVLDRTGVFTPLTTSNTTGGSISQINKYPLSNSSKIFSSGEDLYAGVGLSTGSVDILQFDAAGNEWITLTTVSLPGDQLAVINFSFVSDNKAYIGYSVINSGTLNLLIYDLATNELTQGPEISNVPGSVELLRHLFNIDDIAYFIEYGEAIIELDDVSVVNPTPTLYMFNIRAQEWRVIPHEFPNTFFNVGAFTIDNRGFAGMGQTDGGTTFNYGTDFFEFSPQ